LIKRPLTEDEMERLRQADGDLSVILAKGLGIKLDKVVGTLDG
jgi:hypothetical protein